jgi:hypothetical protein
MMPDQSEVQLDEVRCMDCLRLSYISPEFRERRLRCSRCGGLGLNLTTIKPDPGNARERRTSSGGQ